MNDWGLSMLTLEVLYAVLSGLSPEHLTHLSDPWRSFCYEIWDARRSGVGIIASLRRAFQSLHPYHKQILSKSFKDMPAILNIRGLSRRQKETLVALRNANVASLGELSAALMQDPSNLRKRLEFLTKKGLALKFYRKGSVYYYALPAPIQKDVKASVHQMLASVLSSAASTDTLQELPDLPKLP